MKTLGILLLLLISNADGTSSKRLTAESDIRSINMAIQMFKLNAKMLPTVSDGLQSLVVRPADLNPDSRWIPLLNHLPIDPWGKPYCYLVGDAFGGGYGIYCRGADGQSATQGNDADDINSWRNDQNRLEPWILWALTASALTAIIGFALGRISARKPATTEHAASLNGP
jgi:general secretion pathway protein G